VSTEKDPYDLAYLRRKGNDRTEDSTESGEESAASSFISNYHRKFEADFDEIQDRPPPSQIYSAECHVTEKNFPPELNNSVAITGRFPMDKVGHKVY
jgi:hypothetical protein